MQNDHNTTNHQTQSANTASCNTPNVSQPNNSHFTVRSGAQYRALDIGGWANLHNARFQHAALQNEMPGKLFASQLLQCSGCILSLNMLPAHSDMPFFHQHQQFEELYLIISGQGEFWLDDDVFPVQAGSVVKVEPAAARCWRNTGDEPLYFAVLQTQSGVMPTDHSIEDGRLVAKEVLWR